MISPEVFLLTMYRITGFKWNMQEDLMAESIDSLEALHTLQELEERFSVPLPVRATLPLYYLLETINKGLPHESVS